MTEKVGLQSVLCVTNECLRSLLFLDSAWQVTDDRSILRQMQHLSLIAVLSPAILWYFANHVSLSVNYR